MSYEPNQRYVVTIVDATIVKAKTGTPGIEFALTSDIGDIYHTEWVKNEEKADKVKATLVAIGIPAETIEKREFWLAPGEALAGKRCSIVTMEDEWDGKKRVKVQWLNPLRKKAKPPSEALVDQMAHLFEPIPF